MRSRSQFRWPAPGGLSKTTLRLALLMLPAVFAPAGAEPGPADWPQFRGPGSDGISRETGILKTWPDQGPKVLWRVPLGEGFSGVVVTDGRLFTMFASGGDELVAGFDAATGKELWRQRLDKRYVNEWGNGPRSTPTVDGRVLYAIGANGKLVALEAQSGKKIWSEDLQAAFGAKAPDWGVSTAPAIEGDLLLVNVGGEPGHSIVAFDKKTGGVRWHSHTDIAGYAAPVTATIGGQRQTLFFTGTQLVSVAPADGRVIWSKPWKTSYNINAATPVFISPDRVFVSSGYDTGAAMLRVKSAGEKVTIEELWQSRRMKNQFSSSIYLDGYLYGFDNSTFKCVDAASGEEKWQARGFGHGSLTYADGHFFVLSDKGKLALVEASPADYREKAAFQAFRGKAWTVPTLADRRLFLRNEKELIALDVAK